MKRRLVLTRIYSTFDRTLGYLSVLDDWIEVGRFACLELPWNNNERNKSRIPEGRYLVSPDHNEKFGFYLRLHDVPGRSGILIHKGNLPQHTLGCILLGIRFVDLDADGRFEPGQSKAAMDKLQTLIVEDAALTVVNAI